MKNCPNCGAPMNDGDVFCQNCGKRPDGATSSLVASTTKACPNCGAPMNDGDVFCQNCGKKPDGATSSLVASTSKACPHCGMPMNDGDAFCQNCGKRPNETISFQSVTYTEPKSSTNWKKNITIVLCIVLLAGLGTGGYFYYKDYSEKKAKEEARLKAEQEAREEQQRQAELDAATWERATVDNSEESYELYMKQFPDGKHVDEAKAKLAHIEKMRLTYDENEYVCTSVADFINGLADYDEERMLRPLAPTLEKFLKKTNATKVDAISYMRSLHANDVFSVNISFDTNDIQVEKTLNNQEEPVYTADFSYDQRLEREDTSQETFANVKGRAVLNQQFKITTLTLNKVSSY